MATPMSVSDLELAAYSTLEHPPRNEFAEIWNACSSFQEAVTAVHTALGSTRQEIVLTAKILYRAGIINPLPVKDGSTYLSEEDVLRFALIWNNAPTLTRVAAALTLPLDVVTQRAILLRELGVVLQPLKDFTFGQPPLSRPEVWDVSVDRINDLLNGEIVVRSALLKQGPLRAKTAGMVASMLRLKAGAERTAEQETFISLAESFLRELGVF